jgi:hypothetical protein
MHSHEEGGNEVKSSSFEVKGGDGLNHQNNFHHEEHEGKKRVYLISIFVFFVLFVVKLPLGNQPKNLASIASLRFESC